MSDSVFVTGAGGFIGSNLTYELVKRGHDVIAIDDFSTGLREMVDPKRFVGLPGHFTFCETDINNTKMITRLSGSCSVIFHFAALPRVSYSIDFPLEANQANITGTLSVLEAARKNHCKVVLSSSSSIYGGADNFPTKETERVNPLSPYALHKLTDEYYCKLYGQIHGVDTVCLRYFNVFGPYQRANSAYATVIPAFMNVAVNGGVCRIDGEGKADRDFCFVDNVVSANILAAEHEGYLGGEVFNIACGEFHSVMDVYNKICELSGIQIATRNEPRRIGDPPKSHADITKACEVLGYKPLVKFEEGMVRTFDWWKNGCKI